MWARLVALIAKEFLAVWKDRRSRAVIIGPPLIQLLIFGYAATFDVNHVATAIYDEDGGLAARDLIARFEGSPSFEIVARLTREAEIRQVIDPKRAILVIHVGQTFSRDLLARRPARVQLIVDGRESNTALIILGYASRIVADFNSDWLKAHGEIAPPAHLVVRSWFNPNLESRWFIVPGIVALLTLVVTMVVTALTVAREREVGTFEQLLVTPFRPFEILIGKAVPALVIGLAEGTVIIAVGVFWFGVPLRGDLPLLYAGLFLYILAVIGIGLMISSVCRTQQQAILGAFLFVVPAVILSGFATPIANMPPLIQDLTLVNPMRYFLIIVRGTFLEGLSAGLVLERLWPMAVIAAVSLSGAAWLFRHRLQ
ncbi:ABC-2 type transport system permease protein [Tistlia consotensis]|uniref:ABC-2 type transport system permease protein n=1 Tax=Tistlia consotensis USBA 355 TaxID=560819 RepID=A0A1Y6B792_9PROT|nr:ABC transporter permease [Tistlia consotensis]SME96743.1 ABC-2 type transport system permease protein [Tistlia consotensis USBA 355]SNR56100.1 ABC-2 type transport system permease protein [Tistlia consotensis]